MTDITIKITSAEVSYPGAFSLAQVIVNDTVPFNISILSNITNQTLIGTTKLTFGDGGSPIVISPTSSTNKFVTRLNYTYNTEDTYTVSALYSSPTEGINLSVSVQIIASMNTFLYPIDIGCFIDNPSRTTYSDAIWDWLSEKENTIETCVVACASDNKSIAGVEGG